MRYMLIAVPLEDRELANLKAQLFDVTGGAHTFSNPLSNDGGLTLTHYGCASGMSETVGTQVLALRETLFPNAIIVEYDLDDNPRAALDALEQAGLCTYAA